MNTTATNELRLLGVFAHPDDETFGIGGTLALYARRGVETHVVCATRGEVGEAPSDLRGFASKAAMREAELDCASRTLGLTSVRYLDYRDSGMPNSPDNLHPQSTVAAPTKVVALKIARHMREIRPQVVITFDPIGGYRHPDHIAVHQATVAAFRIAGDPSVAIEELPAFQPQKLYYHAFPRVWLRVGVRLMRLLGRDPHHFGKNGDVDLVSLTEVDFPVHATIAIKSVARIKEEASACHVSQGGGIPRGPVRLLARWFGNQEQFMRAVPAEGTGRMETDLFEGVR